MRWTEPKIRPSFKQYAAMRGAWTEYQKARESAGPTAKKRFDKWLKESNRSTDDRGTS